MRTRDFQQESVFIDDIYKTLVCKALKKALQGETAPHTSQKTGYSSQGETVAVSWGTGRICTFTKAQAERLVRKLSK